jgi:anti-sigma B factor antagonist
MTQGWDTHEDGDTVVVALEGDLDISNAASLEAELERLESAQPNLIVLDFRKAGFVDSTGLSLILNADARARKAGRRLQIVSGEAGVLERLLKTIGLYERLEVIKEPPPATGNA